MRANRIIAAPVAILCALLLAVSGAFASGSGSPHFVTASRSITDSGQLRVDFKEAGLANGQTYDIGITADYEATWACKNNAGGYAPGLRTSVGDVATSAPFPADRNGAVTGHLVAPTVWPPTDITCPNGQTGPVLVSVSYTNIVLTDSTSGATVNLADISRTLVNLGKSGKPS